MKHHYMTGTLALLVTLLLVVACDKTPTVSYKNDVAAIFKSHCAECHLPSGKGFEASGFNLESYQSLMKGTRLGPVIVPGSSVSSTLVILIDGKADPSIQMPHGKGQRIPEDQIKTIKMWIDQGALDN